MTITIHIPDWFIEALKILGVALAGGLVTAIVFYIWYRKSMRNWQRLK